MILMTIIITQSFLYTSTYANDISSTTHECDYEERLVETIWNMSGGSLGHYDLQYFIATCRICKDSRDGTHRIWYPHSFTRSNDWHEGNQHVLEEYCPACDYERTRRFSCNGNPCIFPNRIVFTEI